MEAFVEGTFARLFAGRVHPRDVAVQLTRALEDSALRGAPALRYAVRLNPADAQALLGDHPRLAEALADELVAMARAANLTLPSRPEVLILPDAALKPRSVGVTADSGGPVEPGFTQGMTPPAPGQPVPAPAAFLILDGERTLSLTQPVVSIGRRLDNHIILDDPCISRAHAQLRLRFGRYVLYDLGSTGGTSVNNQRIHECVLQPGDVISLADVPLIYGEEDDGKIPNPKSSQIPEAERRGQFPNPKKDSAESMPEEWT